MMSVAAGFEAIMALPPSSTTCSWNQLVSSPTRAEEKQGEQQVLKETWNSISSSIIIQKHEKQTSDYVHPTMKRSCSLLSQESLEICTENLGSESGSEDYSTDFPDSLTTTSDDDDKSETINITTTTVCTRSMVNYHCSVGRRVSPPRSFPPPLRSISSRDGPCLQMRPQRRDGRLVVEAVPVPSQNYLHAERQDGRLLLSFVNTNTNGNHNATAEDEVDEVETEEQQQDDEEEVEVVDRGTVVEVKVSTQQPKQSKVHRSSIVINKFVSYNGAADDEEGEEEEPVESQSRPHSPVRARLSSTTAAAAVAASSLAATATADSGSSSSSISNKLLFTSKRRNREELLHDMRRCSQLRKPLFIWEPCYIAAST